eukprot:814834_1
MCTNKFFFTLCTITHMVYTSKSNCMNETTIWHDTMNSTHINTNWQTYGDVHSQTNSQTNSPLNSTKIFCGIMHTNRAKNPYMYRITDLSHLIIPINEKLTINYDILPYNLAPNMECQVLYTIITDHVMDSNVEWQLLSRYNNTKNDIIMLSESFEIPITNTNIEIG